MSHIEFAEPPALIFDWGVSSYYAWGLFGMYLLLHEPGALASSTFGDGIALDPLRGEILTARARHAAPLWKTLAGMDHRPTTNAPYLAALGNDLRCGAAATQHPRMAGQPTVAMAVFDRPITREQVQQHDFAAWITCSEWNAAMLRDAGATNVYAWREGIDESLFHPAPKMGLFPGRFVVFSGGKLEHRKGQDIVLAAFHAFHQRHPEALLLTSWASVWDETQDSRIPRDATGKADIKRWAVDGGLPPDAIRVLEPMPNMAMPLVMREADVALFCNRAEGGTNAVARECMACGVPVILPRNTGHLELIRSYLTVLERQGPSDHEGWGESDPDEALEALEWAYQSRVRYQPTMPTWSEQIPELVNLVKGLA